MTREEAQRRVAKGFGWWETEWRRQGSEILPVDVDVFSDVYCARIKDGTIMRVRWP